jgi:molybdenum cofactor cytidylyltransferase
MRNIGAVVLAAGESSRLGQAKQLLEFRGETLVRHAARAASEAGCDPVLVVIGENRDAIASALGIRDSRIPSSPGREEMAGPVLVENREWRRGVGTSIRSGLEQLPHDLAAVVLLTCDQPFVDASIVRQLLLAWEETGKPIVASGYANTLGVPALFDRCCFDALLELPDDSGAKTLIASRPAEVCPVGFEQGAVDIDTPEDFERLTENHG